MRISRCLALAICIPCLVASVGCKAQRAGQRDHYRRELWQQPMILPDIPSIIIDGKRHELPYVIPVPMTATNFIWLDEVINGRPGTLNGIRGRWKTAHCPERMPGCCVHHQEFVPDLPLNQCHKAPWAAPEN